ncbi:MAG: ATP-binding protein [Candidatus Calescibacterium sp.]
MKIFHKVLLISVLLVIYSGGLSSFWGLLFVKKEYEERVKNMLSFTAENVSDAIARYIETATNTVIASIASSTETSGKLTKEQKFFLFSRLLKNLKNIAFISDGEVSVGDISFSGTKDEKKEKISIKNGYIVFSDGITIVIDKSPIDQIILSFSIGTEGKIYIEENLEGISGVIKEDGEFLKAFKKIGQTPIYAVVSIPYSEINKTWKKIQNRIAILISGGILISILASFLLSGSITKALSRISRLARKYSKLDFSEKVISYRKDEVGDVVRAFHTMITEIERAWEELKLWNLELEKRVEERTAQLKKMHENLLVAEKMASVGTLGAGVAHEINNPLASAIGFLQIAKVKVQDESVQKYISRAIPNLERIKNIVGRMSYFAEIQMKAEYISLSPKKVISEVIEEFKYMGKEIEAQLEDVDTIYAEEEQFKVAISEVIKNAFLAAKSKIRVVLGQTEKTIFIRVSDDGEKIPEEFKTRIFDAFFTLKKWEGVGLGLTIAKTILTNLRGDIILEDDNKTFRIEIDKEKNKEIKEFLEKEEIKKPKTHLV